MVVCVHLASGRTEGWAGLDLLCAPQAFWHVKNRATLGAAQQNGASSPISPSMSWDPGAACQLPEPSTTVGSADKEGESQRWCKEQLCTPLSLLGQMHAGLIPSVG